MRVTKVWYKDRSAHLGVIEERNGKLEVWNYTCLQRKIFSFEEMDRALAFASKPFPVEQTVVDTFNTK